jgi:hypothetical protein
MTEIASYDINFTPGNDESRRFALHVGSHY